jgi:glycosyltransferase involved in cell wall biosynthesis
MNTYFANSFNPGCNCCDTPPTCTGNIQFNVSGCCQSGSPTVGIPSPTVTATGPSGPVTVHNAGSGYFISLADQGAGSYTITASLTDFYTQNVTVSGACGSNTNLGTIYLYPTYLTFTVGSFCGGLNGSVLTLSGAYSNTYTFSGHTGFQSPETITIDVADIAGHGIPPDYTVTLTQPRYEDVVRTYSWNSSTSGSVNWACSDTLTFGTLSDCYICCEFGDALANQYPTTPTFLLTTPMGTVVIDTTAEVITSFVVSSAHPNITCPSGSTCTACNQPLESGLAIEFAFLTNCGAELQNFLPAVTIYYISCLDGTGSAYIPDGFGQGVQVNWTSQGSVVPLTLTGNIPDSPPERIFPYMYINGDYTLSEVACGSSGTGTDGVSMMSLSMLPPFGNLASRSDKIRVGFICPCLINGGAETWMASLARSLDQRFEVVGVAINGSTIEPSSLEAYEGICPVSQGTQAVRTLAKNVDILVCWGSHDFARAWRGDPDRPFLLSTCHIPPEWDEGLYSDVTDIDGFVAVSEAAFQVIPEPNRSKAVVIPNAVDQNRLISTRSREEVRHSWGVDADDYVVGYLGRLSAEKNPMAIIELAKKLQASGLSTQVVIVGSGFQEEEVQVASLGMENVHLVGPDHRAGDVLSGFDTLVVPSNFESYGLSIVEACSLGIPVISTEVGIAKVVPGLTRVVPIPATGRNLYEAFLKDGIDILGTQERVSLAKKWANENASLEVFGKRWSNHLAGLRQRGVVSTVSRTKQGCGPCERNKKIRERIFERKQQLARTNS